MQNSKSIIQLGQHYNRSLQDSAVIQYNPEDRKIEIVNKAVPSEHVQVLRNRIKNSGVGPNIVMEAMVIHDTDQENLASYRITTNRYGLTVVPWSLVNPEETRKDADIISFETKDTDRILTISRNQSSIVSAAYQYANDGGLLYDTMLKLPEDENTVSAIINDKLYIFYSDVGFDIVLIFNDLGEKTASEIFEEFNATRAFLV